MFHLFVREDSAAFTTLHSECSSKHFEGKQFFWEICLFDRLWSLAEKILPFVDNFYSSLSRLHSSCPKKGFRRINQKKCFLSLSNFERENFTFLSTNFQRSYQNCILSVHTNTFGWNLFSRKKYVLFQMISINWAKFFLFWQRFFNGFAHTAF